MRTHSESNAQRPAKMRLLSTHTVYKSQHVKHPVLAWRVPFGRAASQPPPSHSATNRTAHRPVSASVSVVFHGATLCDGAVMAATGNTRKRKLLEWEPKQVVVKEAMDLRGAALGPRGYKVRPVKSGPSTYKKILAAQAAAAAGDGGTEQQQQPAAMIDDNEAVVAPAVKRQKAEGVAYRNVSVYG